MRKRDPYICHLQETDLRSKDTHRLKVKGWKKIFHANGEKKSLVAVLISDKIDFKTKVIVRDKKGHYMIKGTIQQEDITLVNIYTPNTGGPKYVKQILMDLKEEINRNIVIVGSFNTPLTSMDRTSRQKINKESVNLNDTLHRKDLINIFRAFHHIEAEYTLFPIAHGTFIRVGHMLKCKTSFNKFKMIEIISSIFTGHNAMKLEVSHKKNTEKYAKTWKLNNMLLNNEWGVCAGEKMAAGEAV